MTTSPADLKDFYAVIKPINDIRADFVSDLDLLPTFPFPRENLRRAVRGDYLNVFVTFDLTSGGWARRSSRRRAWTPTWRTSTRSSIRRTG